MYGLNFLCFLEYELTTDFGTGRTVPALSIDSVFFLLPEFLLGLEGCKPRLDTHYKLDNNGPRLTNKICKDHYAGIKKGWRLRPWTFCYAQRLTLFPCSHPPNGLRNKRHSLWNGHKARLEHHDVSALQPECEHLQKQTLWLS